MANGRYHAKNVVQRCRPEPVSDPGSDHPHVLILTDNEQLSTSLLQLTRNLAVGLTIATRDTVAAELACCGPVIGFIVDGDGEDDLADFASLICAVRNRGPNAFVVWISRVVGFETELFAFQLGIDHLFAKPVRPEIFQARILSLIRRHLNPQLSTHTRSIRCIHDLVLDLNRRSATTQKRDLHLTPTEFAVLDLLSRAPGRPVSLDAIGAQLWGWDTGNYYDHIKCHVSRLRRKLADGGSIVTIRAVRMAGYALEWP